MNIVVLDGYTMGEADNPWDPVASFGTVTVHDRTPEDEIVERARKADMVLTNKTPLSRKTIKALPGLKYIGVLATGYDQVDLDAARERGIPVTNVPGYSTEAVAQFVIAMMLELASRVALHDKAVHEGEWAACPDFCFWKAPLVELAGKTMGIVGFGSIGARVARLANAFGMNVVAYNRSEKPAPDFSPFEWVSLPSLFAQSDFISLHCPLTSENRGMVGERYFDIMKDDACLINTARGPLVDEEALVAALRAGKIGGAALDVTPNEPLPKDSPLMTAPNLIITPHIAWATVESRRRLMKMAADNIRAFIEGSPTNVVNG